MLDMTALEPFVKLDKDLKKAAVTLSTSEARFLVDAYYTIQDYRIRFGNQIRALSESAEPHDLIKWMYANAEGLEKNIQKALDSYSKGSIVGRWARSIPGIGPVIASGLLAHFDITKAPSAGHFISYMGYNPERAWEKGQKRPWNASLKRLGFLLGESFIKVQNRPTDIYGKVYAERKRLEQEANEYLFYADQAEEILRTRRLGNDTEAFKWYSQGKLPPAHIHARARRYAVKGFISHLHEVWYETEFRQPAPRPYAIEHLGHVEYVSPPHWPLGDEEEIVMAEREEVVEKPLEMRVDETNSEPPPRKELYLTLDLQLLRFKNILQESGQLEQIEIPSEAILEGYVSTALVPKLEERIARWKAIKNQVQVFNQDTEVNRIS